MTDTIRCNVTDAVSRGTIISLLATDEDGKSFQINGDWRPMQHFLDDVTLPCWIDWDPDGNTVTPCDQEA